LCEGTGRITLVDIQKLDDTLATWLGLVQLEWIVRRPNPDFRGSIAASMYVRVGTKEPTSLRRTSERRQTGYADDKHTNGTDDAKEPLAILVTERKFGQT
jgi:hypothetical protein